VNICITSVGTATSVGVIKNIRKYNKSIKIVGTDINPYGYTAGSQLVDCYYQIPLAVEQDYKDIIFSILIKENIDYFFPISDIEIQTASLWSFPMGCKCLLAKKSVLNLVKDKLQCTLEMEKIGLHCPPILESGYMEKCILRDRIGVGSKGIHIIDNAKNVIVKENQFIQQYISGKEYTVDVLCDNDGHPFYIIPRVRLEVKAGVATKVKIEDQQEIIGDVKRVLKQISFPGFSNFQFIRSDAGMNYFIEINPRIGGCTSASLLAAPTMFALFMEMISGFVPKDILDRKINSDVRWGTVVTRYYEEIVYYGKK
jgi:Carbamoylphosphate synthase large subunit (split gene in MJ)